MVLQPRCRLQLSNGVTATRGSDGRDQAGEHAPRHKSENSSLICGQGSQPPPASLMEAGRAGGGAVLINRK